MSKETGNSSFLSNRFRTIPKRVKLCYLCNRHRPGETWPQSKTFKVLNEENVATEGKKTSKYRTIELCGIVEDLKTRPTKSGWQKADVDALRSLAGKIPTKYIYTMDDIQEDDEDTSGSENPDGDFSYGTAYEAFGGGKNGKEHAMQLQLYVTYVLLVH